MAKKRKTIRMVVEVSCPTWLTAAQARKEVRSLINDQVHFGHHNGNWHEGFESVEEYNFRARSVRAAPRGES